MDWSLRELAQQCKKVATEILDSCAGLNEVRILLKEKAGAQKFFKYVENYKYPQLTLAVEHKHKEFVSHAYCQQVIEKDYLDNMKWKERSLLYKLIFILVQSMVGFLTAVPFMIVRLPRWYAKGYYGSSEVHMYKGRGKHDLTKIQKVLKYLECTKMSLDIPLNRFICHTLCYGIFLIILISTAMSPSSKPGVNTWVRYDWNYFVIFLYSSSHMMQDMHFLINSSWKMFSTFWRRYFSALHILLNFAYILKCIISVCEYSEQTENAKLLVHTSYALATILAIMGALYWFQLHEKMGPIIIQLSHVLTDFATNVMVILTVYIAFLVGLFFLIFGWNSSIYDLGCWDLLNRLALDMGWAILNPGPFELQLPELPISIDASVNISGNIPELPDLPDVPHFPRPRPERIPELPDIPLPGNISRPGNWTIGENLIEFIDGAHRLRYHFITYTLYFYQVFTVILLLNLLIAAMSSTVQKLQAQKDMNWKFERTRIRITYFDDVYAVPVPLNAFLFAVWVPYSIFALMYFLWKGDSKFLKRFVNCRRINNKNEENTLSCNYK